MRRAITVLMTSLAACASEGGSAAVYEAGEELSGGATTVFDTSRDAFARPARNLAPSRRDAFFVGNAFFNRNWVTAPASTTGIDGLGPTFNATSCSACHFKDGRGTPPGGPDDTPVGLLVRLSVPGTDAHGGPRDEPSYGGQLQVGAIRGVPVEARVRVSWVETPGSYADGSPYVLRAPRVELADAAFGALDPAVLTSPRVAPAIIGVGLLDAVPEATIRARADDADADGDGISGRANEVWDVELGRTALGRLAWKGNQPSLRQQNAGAFLGDVGITSSIFPAQNCPSPQTACAMAPTGGEPELGDDKLADVTFYLSTLGVPARRGADDPTVLRGKGLFHESGCASCHSPSMETAADFPVPELAGQTIHPYSDLLLHDMGEGLADGRPDYLADGREWRTPPLWGIGLTPTVSRHSYYLHDGRARGLAEAILWHGGEAERAKEAFRTMAAAEREDLLRFLESL